MDAVTLLAQTAHTTLLRATAACNEGEAKARFQTAVAAVEDALEQREEDLRLLANLNLLADCLALPGKGSES